MKTYKYAFNSAKINEFEDVLNQLGAVGWRVVHIEYNEEKGRVFFIVEKEAKDG